MRFAGTLFMLLAVVSFASAATWVASEKDDLKQLQGEWTAKVQTDDGEKEATVSITGKKIRFAGPNGQEWYEGTFEIDADAKPKRISVLIIDCPYEQFKKQTSEGIYTLDDKTFTICATAPGAPEGPSGWDDEKARTLECKKK